MPFCPSWHYEYISQVTKYPDCGAGLVESLAPEREPESVELVRIASYPFEIQAQVARLKLHSHGIRAAITNERMSQTDMNLVFADGWRTRHRRQHRSAEPPPPK